MHCRTGPRVQRGAVHAVPCQTGKAIPTPGPWRPPLPSHSTLLALTSRHLVSPHTVLVRLRALLQRCYQGNLIAEHHITDLADLMKVSEKLPPVLMRQYRGASELMWVTNRIEQIDPAFRCRFACHQALKNPPPGAREQLMRKTLDGARVREALVARLTARQGLTPAQMGTAVRFAQLAAAPVRTAGRRKAAKPLLDALIECQLRNADRALGRQPDAAARPSPMQLCGGAVTDRDPGADAVTGGIGGPA